MTDGEMKMYRELIARRNRALVALESAAVEEFRKREQLGAVREEVKAVLELEAKVFNETVGSVKPALQFLLTRIGSWTAARWDQHLRDQYGDEKADPMIAALESLFNIQDYGNQKVSQPDDFSSVFGDV